MERSIVRRITKYALILVAFLVVSSIMLVAPAEAGDGSEQNPWLAEEICGPLPPGVTPDYTFQTKAYLSFRPNPVGVGQPVLVNIWTSPGQYHAFLMVGFKVYIKDPDGNVNVKTMNSYYGDASAWFEFTPNKPGVWKLKFENPGTYIPAGWYIDSPTGQAFMAQPKYYLAKSVYYAPSSTDWLDLIVQEEMVCSWPPSPLPTDYWTRPINPVNREWWVIGGNFPWTGVIYYPNGRKLYSGTVSTFGGGVAGYKYHAYVKGPESAHIVWKRQGALAGIVGGEYTYQWTLSGSPGTPSIIFMGRCYQSITKNVDGKSTAVLQCYDLRTGEIYWEVKLPTTTTYWFGMPMTTAVAPQFILYEVTTPEPVPGAAAWKSMTISLVRVGEGRLIKWSPWNGLVTLNVSLATGITSGVVYNNEWVLSVQDLGAAAAPNRYRLINWTMAGSSTNFKTRVYGNISWPVSGITLVDYEANVVIYNPIWNDPPGPQWCIGWMATAIDLKTGQILWTKSTNDTIHENMYAPSTAIANHGKFAFACQHRHWVCFDARTGQKLWESELSAFPWGNWWPYNTASYDFNETKSAIITSTYEGVYAIDWDTGKIIWHFTDPHAVPFENPYTTHNCTAAATPFFTGVLIADGKVYCYNGEHTQSQPYARDWKMFCLNATTGELIWYIWNPMSPGAVADGYLVAGNPYDGYMYVFGKGKSQTTVTVSQDVVAKGSTILIKGSVLDMSPAQPGTPCVSKESMTTWMAYLHLQMPIDGIWHNETITGVPVMLTAIHEDGSYVDIGTVITDGYSGTFAIPWTPPKEGTYKIIASFNGDESYSSSSATTWITVVSAPEVQPAAPTTPDYTPHLLGLTVAVIVIAILVIYNLITVKKLQK